MRAGDQVGPYRLERRLGAGGMKQVWRARRPGGEPVALAMLFRFDLHQFVHERTLAARVDSPHVARVLDGFVHEDGTGVVVSELCEGLDLARYRRAHPLSPGAACALVAEMATGLAAIHAAHVLHRDIKPSNAILTATGVKLIDFGLSLPADDERTGPARPASPAGTLAYMAPDVVHDNVDARTDTYALGVSLYHLVVGHPPLADLSTIDWLRRLATFEPLPQDELRGVPVIVGAMIARLCEPRRDQRPYVADVVADLAALTRSLRGARPAYVTDDGPDPDLDLDLAPLPHAGDPQPAPPPASFPPPTKVGLPMVGDSALPMWIVPFNVPSPAHVVLGWPHLPLLALVPAGDGTRIHGVAADGHAPLFATVPDHLLGGLVADLDHDGVGELYTWGARGLHVIDARGRLCATHAIAPRPGAHPWDDGALAPVLLGEGRGRVLAVGDRALDPTTGAYQPLPGGREGRGDRLVPADGFSGLAAHGAAGQRFRGDLGTPAAILARPGAPGYVVAALERVLDGRPTVRLGLWAADGARIATAEVGRYAFETAPLSALEDAQRPETRLFGAGVAPLAVLGGGDPADDVIVVPFLQNAAWFGPLLVAFDGHGALRWRERLPALLATPRAPPMLVDLDDSGRPQLLWSDGRGQVERRDARTGAPLPSLAIRGTPIAALDFTGRGELHLVSWDEHGVVLTRHERCLPGLISWLPTRGDLWRSGTLGPDRLPVGPRT